MNTHRPLLRCGYSFLAALSARFPPGASPPTGTCAPNLLPVLLAMAALWTAGHGSAAVTADREGAILHLGNGRLTVAYDTQKGSFQLASAGVAFVEDGRLLQGAGKASLIETDDLLGKGRAIVIDQGAGRSCRLALYPELPFLCIRQDLANPTGEAIVVDRLLTAGVPLVAGPDPAKLRVLGCDGLTDASLERVSYSFLAVADPTSQAGVVGGWITHHRASGIVLSHPGGGTVELQARSEYGALRLAPGASATGEVFVLGRFDNALAGLEAYADATATANEVKLPPSPAGYCTWYHAKASNQEKMSELVDFVKEKGLVDYGFGLMQIDDGWQRSGRDFSGQRGGGYAAGMDKTAATITGAGMRAGLWLIPFGWDPKRDIFKEHQDWFVHRKDSGDLYTVTWGGTCLDMTHPGARDLVSRSVNQICRTWGYKYIKIDGLWTGMAVKILYADPAYRDDGLGDAVFHDPDQTNLESYRSGLRLVREAAGKDVYILGCNTAQNYRTLGASFGLVDGMRVGQDIGVKWNQILNCATLGTRLYFLHNRVWHNDADCLMLRDPLTLVQARTWGTWIGLSGQLNIVSEWLPDLSAEKLDIVRRTMPNHGLDARPVDLLDEPLARVWHLADHRGSRHRDVVGLFNWSNKEATVSVDCTRLGLDPKATYHGYDYWSDRFLDPVSGKIEAVLPPYGCANIALVPADDVPRVLGTSRHVSQGAVDLENETWDPARMTLGATSKVVADDPYQIRVVFPAGRTLESVALANGGDATIAIEHQESRRARVTTLSPQTGPLQWTATFK